MVVAVMLLLLIVKNEGLVDYYRWLAIVYGPFVVSELFSVGRGQCSISHPVPRKISSER